MRARPSSRHIDDAGVALERAREHQIPAFDSSFVPLEGAAGRKLQATAEVLPATNERGQHGDGAGGLAAVLAALDAVVHADNGRRGRRVFAGEAFDVGYGDTGPAETHSGVYSAARCWSSAKPCVFSAM